MTDLDEILAKRDNHGHEIRQANCGVCYPFGIWEAEVDRSATVERYAITGAGRLFALVFSARDANSLVELLNEHARD